MSVKSKTGTTVRHKAQAEIRKLNRTAGRALRKDTPEHKKIFDTHAKAWKELANK